MYTQLKMIAKHGLEGSPEKVRKYLELFIFNNSKEHSDPIQKDLSKIFKGVLENRQDGKATLDDTSGASLRQLFQNNYSCYADCDDVVLAMDEDRFVEVVQKYFQ